MSGLEQFYLSISAADIIGFVLIKSAVSIDYVYSRNQSCFIIYFLYKVMSFPIGQFGGIRKRNETVREGELLSLLPTATKSGSFPINSVHFFEWAEWADTQGPLRIRGAVQ